MRRMFRARTAVATAVAILAVGGVAGVGGAYAATRGGGTITACVHDRGGGLYLANKCARHDRRVRLEYHETTGRAGSDGPAGPGGSRGHPRSASDPVLRSDHIRRHRQRLRVAGER